MIFSRGRRAATLALVLLAALAGASACSSAQAGQPSSSSSPRVPQGDLHWLNAAHQANLAEEQAGQLAETNASTQQVKSDGKALNHDHALLDAAVLRLARKLKVTITHVLPLADDRVRDQLMNETGAKFDHDFVDDMLTAHEQLIKATKTEIQHGSSAQVKALARQALPVLENHLRMMQATAGTG